VNPAAEGSEPSGHPNGRKADSGWPHRSVKPDPSGRCRFDTCSAHSSPRGAVDSARGSELRGRPFESARGRHGAHLAGAGGGLQPRRCRVRSPGASPRLVVQGIRATVSFNSSTVTERSPIVSIRRVITAAALLLGVALVTILTRALPAPDNAPAPSI
jgi:hypothetical protein